MSPGYAQRSAASAALMLAVAIPWPALAQTPTSNPDAWTTGLALGLARQPDRRGGHLARHGAIARGTLAWRFTSRAALALELALTSFWETSDHVHEPCLEPEPPFGCHEPTGTLNVASFGLALNIAEATHHRAGFYYMAGAGWHHALSHPTDYDALRPGLILGLGVAVPRGAVTWHVDLRHHRVFGWDSHTWSLTPLTVGVTF